MKIYMKESCNWIVNILVLYSWYLHTCVRTYIRRYIFFVPPVMPIKINLFNSVIKSTDTFISELKTKMKSKWISNEKSLMLQRSLIDRMFIAWRKWKKDGKFPNKHVYVQIYAKQKCAYEGLRVAVMRWWEGVYRIRHWRTLNKCK